LAEALVAAQAELPLAIGKDADGQIGTRQYRYLTLDKLIAETRPILQKHGLSIIQAPTTLARREQNGETSLVPALATRLIHTTSEAVATFSHADGVSDGVTETIEYVMPLYLSDKTMQGLGSAITYARRYAWQSVLGIAAEEDTDGPAAVDEDVPF
jgi:hypothetical protein